MHVRKILLAIAATAPAALSAVTLPEHEIAGASSAQLRAAYLECDRVTAEMRVDLGVMITCGMVGDVLRRRDFGGDFERQLQWWRAARGPHRKAHGGKAPAPSDAEFAED
jgi:hypothetical protein